MNDELSMIDLPGFALRALHSAWTDWLLRAPESVRDSMIERCSGATFQRFCLALMAHRLVVINKLDDDSAELFIGIGVPVANAAPWQLFWVPSTHTGLDWSLMAALATQNLDARLAQMLEEQ